MTGHQSKYLVLTAMIFAVAMMFVDQTIVAIAIPKIQSGLSLSATGSQWVINGYLLALAALFAFGGKLTDVVGHRRMVIVGVIGFAGASALCGAAPMGKAGEWWLILFRFVQGAFGAVLFPAALAIVVNAFEPGERGKALAIFFGITGGLTSIGPIAGSFLLQWTWRSIFWINIPIAVIALLLTLRANPSDERRRIPIDWRGTVLVSAGMGLAVLGLQQAGAWGWTSAKVWGCLATGAVLLAVFVIVELRIPDPLIDLGIFTHAGFVADNVVLFLICICFVPLFFFSSIYAQVVLHDNAGKASLYILVFFLGFAGASQIGGRILDRRGARPAAIAGSALAAAGFVLWADQLPEASLASQWYWIVLTGAGIGLALTPVSTDAINRAPRGSYGEVTGVTQTVRYFASSLGLAVLGSLLISENRSHVTSSLTSQGVPRAVATRIAGEFSASAPPSATGHPALPAGIDGRHLFETIQHDVALSLKAVLLVMAGVMIASFVVAVRRLERGLPEQVSERTPEEPASAAAGG